MSLCAGGAVAFESKRPIAHVAQDLGIHKESLRTRVGRRRRTSAAGAIGRPARTVRSCGGCVRRSPSWRRANAIRKDSSVYSQRGSDRPGDGDP